MKRQFRQGSLISALEASLFCSNVRRKNEERLIDENPSRHYSIPFDSRFFERIREYYKLIVRKCQDVTSLTIMMTISRLRYLHSHSAPYKVSSHFHHTTSKQLTTTAFCSELLIAARSKRLKDTRAQPTRRKQLAVDTSPFNINHPVTSMMQDFAMNFLCKGRFMVLYNGMINHSSA